MAEIKRDIAEEDIMDYEQDIEDGSREGNDQDTHSNPRNIVGQRPLLSCAIGTPTPFQQVDLPYTFLPFIEWDWTTGDRPKCAISVASGNRVWACHRRHVQGTFYMQKETCSGCGASRTEVK